MLLRRRLFSVWISSGPACARSRVAALVGLFWLLGLLGGATLAYAETRTEYGIKAGIIVNFAAYTEWPDTVNDTLQLCVYGPDPFGENLDKFQGKKIGRRSLAVRRVNGVDGLADCQMVFITRPMIGNLSRVLDRTNGRPVVTIADSPGAAHQGVVFNLIMDDTNVSFQANLSAARGNAVKLNANMLRLATEVIK